MNRSAHQHHPVTDAAEHLAGGLEHAGEVAARVSTAAGSATESAAGTAADTVRSVGNTVQDVAGRATEGVRNAIDYSRTQSKEMKKGFDKAVAANPLTAVAIAAGAGILVGLMWRRRR